MRNRIFIFLFFIFLASTPSIAQYKPDLEAIYKIKNEGISNSQVMETATHLTDICGPRLTGTPGFMKAGNWAVEKLKEWGLENSNLEPWGVFGKGWTLEKFSIEMTAPDYMPLVGFPKAWINNTNGTISGNPVLIAPESVEDLDKFKGKLNGAIVLFGEGEDTEPNFEADAERLTEEDLEELRKAKTPGVKSSWAKRRKEYMARWELRKKAFKLFKEEGVAVILQQSRGTDGTIFVQSGGSFKTNGELGLPQVVVAAEHYSRLVTLAKEKIEVNLNINVQSKIHDQDSLGYNVIAEIPGTDLEDEVVMLGGHLDSWHASTGATDNAGGCSIAMEAVRIIQELNLKPRRTIRIALWSAEEHGLYGSYNYVKNHFGDYKIKEVKPEHEKISVYFNLDNGAGKIRGIYAQKNDAVKPIFEEWLKPFHDMDAKTVTLRSTGSTDHIPFDRAGIPGFQFLQDELDYFSRTHHSNLDAKEKLVKSDLIQASIIMAAFVYNAAMMDEKLPRKPILVTKK